MVVENPSGMNRDEHDDVDLPRTGCKVDGKEIEEENNEMVVLLGKNFQGCTWKYIGR